MGSLVGDLAAISILLAVPAAAGLLLARRLGVRSNPAQAILGLAGPCLIGYAAFWLYLSTPEVGELGTLALFAAVTGYLLFEVVNGGRAARRFLGSWAAPGAMVVAAAAFQLGFGFLHGGTAHPLVTGAIRYTAQLPGDNQLPYVFANQLLAVHRPLPRLLFAGWSGSDRPPLQAGLYLLVRAFLPQGRPVALRYQVVGVAVQSFWMPALWSFLRTAAVPRRTIGSVLSAVLLSGFVIVNSFFVWPKLLPAAFLVLLAALLLGRAWPPVRYSRVIGVICGLASGLALLAHEGSALTLIPLAVLLVAARRRWPGFGCAAAAVLVVAVLMLPWLLFQQLYLPPGTKLTKLQLAGQDTVNPKQSLLSAIAAAYGPLTPAEIADRKWDNLILPFTHEGRQVSAAVKLGSNLLAARGMGARRRDEATRTLRADNFFYLLPTLGLFGFGPIAMLGAWLRRRRARAPDLAMASRTWGVLGLSLIVWTLVLFAPAATVVHQGSYATELLYFGAAAIALYGLSPSLTVGLAAVTALFGVASYFGLEVFAASSPYAAGLTRAVHPGAAVLAGLGLAVAISAAFLAPAASLADSPDALPRAGRKAGPAELVPD